MSPYYCIVHLPGVPCREIASLAAADDATAQAELNRMAQCWPGYETIALYQGERAVSVLANPSLGFVIEPLRVPDRAA